MQLAARTCEKLLVFTRVAPLSRTQLFQPPSPLSDTSADNMVAATCMQIAQPTSVARKGLAGAPGVWAASQSTRSGCY